MNLKMTLAALLLAPLALTACKKNEAPEQTAAASETAAVEEAVTAEQQAAIDAIDQPELDERTKTFLLKLQMHLQMLQLRILR